MTIKAFFDGCSVTFTQKYVVPHFRCLVGSTFLKGRSWSRWGCRFLVVSFPCPQGNQPTAPWQILYVQWVNTGTKYRVSFTKLLFRSIYEHSTNQLVLVFFCCYVTITRGVVIHCLLYWVCRQLLRHSKYACFHSTCIKGHFCFCSLFVHECVSESHPEQQNVQLIAPELLKMENCRLFSPTHVSHSTFVSKHSTPLSLSPAHMQEVNTSGVQTNILLKVWREEGIDQGCFK